jgi:nicotinate phosphoribosyltransferase
MKDKPYYISEELIAGIEISQVFAISNLWFKQGIKNNIATYDLVVRNLPKNRNFMILTGIQEAIDGILNFGYSKEMINYLVKSKTIGTEFADYLMNFKFTGEVHAMKEGTIFFPNEPILRIKAPIIEGNLLTAFLINVISSNTIFSTKTIRSIIAAKGKMVIGPGVIRGQSFESIMKCSRSSYLVGSIINCPAFSLKYNIPIIENPVVNAYHAYIKSMSSELEAMREITKEYKNVFLMVDTFNFDKGIENAIKVAKELEQRNQKLLGIVIDSGDLEINTKKAKKQFTKHGLNYLKICVASNLDEFKINDLMNKKLPIDSFLVVSELISSADDPKLDIVYKISQIIKNKKTIPLAKLTPCKESYPGDKNVYRIYTNNKKFSHDIIGLESENLGTPLLQLMIKDGKKICNESSLDKIKDYIKSQINLLPKELLSINKFSKYPVKISKKLLEEFNKIKREHENGTL